MGKAFRELKLAQQQVDADGNPTRVSEAMAEKNPARAQSELMKLQKADFDKRFAPLEEELRADVLGGPEKEARAAGEATTKQIGITREAFMRDLGRSGTALTNRQKGTIDRSRGLAEARAFATAKNVTRSKVDDRNTEAQADLIGIGREVQGGANKDLSAASSLQTQRENANDQADSAQKSQNTQMLATGLGLAAAFLI